MTLRFIFLAIMCCQFTTSRAQLNMNLLSHLTYPESLASVWGYASGGKEYALVGVYSGLSIVDVTVPTAPEEVQFVPTAVSSWHEMKTWSHYAYVVNEHEGGMLIVDLSGLPGAVTYTNWTGGTLDLQTGHTIWIDENGIAYINGSNLADGGVIFLDLTADPMDPVYLGQYDDYYVHDSYVRGDTMWTSEIVEGWFRVVDVSDKQNPVVLAQQTTPSEFNHNTSLSGDGNYLFTTDEKSNSYVASYDVSDLSNITELDRFQATPGSKSIGHNVHMNGDYAVVAYYRDGVIIADAHYPDNLVKVGSYDTNPLSGSGYNGCWEAYPYLPSGNILASDIEEGLYVLGVNYVPACYLRGTVTDYTSAAPLNGVSINIVNASGTTVTSGLSGKYATGFATAGTYSVKFTKSGYHAKTISNVALAGGLETILNTTLKLTSLPACTVPATLAVSNATANSAQLKWSDEYASQYTIKLKNLANNSTSTYTAYVNNFTVTGLAECTDYQFRVKAKCSSGSWTAFSSWFNFSTPGTSCGKMQPASLLSEAEWIHVYPNPFSSGFNLEVALESEGDVHLLLFDISGRMLLDKEYADLPAGRSILEMDGSGLTAGMYFCKLQAKGQNAVTRVVKD